MRVQVAFVAPIAFLFVCGTALPNTCWEVIFKQYTQFAVRGKASHLPVLRLNSATSIAPVHWNPGSEKPFIVFNDEQLVSDPALKQLVPIRRAFPSEHLPDLKPVGLNRIIGCEGNFVCVFELPLDPMDPATFERSFRVSYLDNNWRPITKADNQSMVLVSVARRINISAPDEINRKSQSVQLGDLNLGKAGSEEFEQRIAVFDLNTGRMKHAVEIAADFKNRTPFDDLAKVLETTFRSSKGIPPTTFLSKDENYLWIVPQPKTSTIFRVDLKTGLVSLHWQRKIRNQEYFVFLGPDKDFKNVLLLRAHRDGLGLIEVSLTDPYFSYENPIEGSIAGRLAGFSPRYPGFDPGELPEAHTFGLGALLLAEREEAFVGTTSGLLQIDLKKKRVVSQNIGGSSGTAAAFPQVFLNGKLGYWHYQEPTSPLPKGNWTFVVLGEKN